MFGDIVKIAAKVAALVAGTALIIALFSVITIPSLDLTSASDYINTAYSVCLHYIPGFSVLWSLGIGIITLDLGILGVRFGLIAVKWILKVNE